MSGRARAAGKPKEQETELLKALKFVSVAQYAPGDALAQSPYQQHCTFVGGQVVAFNGIIAAGYPVPDELGVCPNTHLFIKALEKVRGAYSLSELSNDKIVIKTDKLKVHVDCVAPYAMTMVTPDEGLYQIGDNIKDAAKAAGIYVTDGAQTVLQASIITRSHSFAGTNNQAIVEAYHGWHMPEGLLLPMSFFDTVAKVPLTITRFGYTPNQSLTIYFENGAWLRSQLYLEPVPDVGKILDAIEMSRCTDLPAGFWEACDAVVPHSIRKEVYFDHTRVMSHETDTTGAQHLLEVPFRKLFSYDLLRKLQNYCPKADFVTHEDRAVFAGDNVRAVVMIKAWR